MEELVRRVGQCETDIKGLSKEVTENTTNMGHIQKIVDDFSLFINKSIETLTRIDLRIESLDTNQKRFERKLGEIEVKVDENEDAHKVDTRKVLKDVITKVLFVIFGLGFAGSIFYILFVK